MNKLEILIRTLEKNYAFKTSWHAIFLNPFFITRKAIYNEIYKFSKSCSDSDSILDVGCGIKPYRELFQSSKYIGIDVKGGGHRDESKIVDKYFDGVKIPYPSNSFNIVIATEVLEHAFEPENLLKEMHRVLKPNGRIFVTMPFVWPEHSVPFDFQRYTSFKLKKLFANAGFIKIRVSQTTGVFGTCGQLISDFLSGQINSIIWNSQLKYGVKFISIRTLVLLICFPTQVSFLLLDLICGSRGIPLDFAVSAQKHS